MLNTKTQKLVFVVLFVAVSLVAYSINFSPILGTNKAYFTFFQFVGPITGGFLGPVFGAIAVLLTEIVRYLLSPVELNLFSLARFFPMVLAAIYFGTKHKRHASVVALACMVLFWLHPVGSQVWFYALYWLIPLGASFFAHRLFFRSLGTTFTAHAVGSTAFLYAFPTTPELWVMLIPIVAVERIAFALGISVSYVAFTTMLSKLPHSVSNTAIRIEQAYVLNVSKLTRMFARA
jgi:hypothetical protein